MRPFSRLALTLFLLLLPAAFTFADDPAAIIGMDLPMATGAYGLPRQLLTYRGSEESRDAVVFYYPTHMYLFWYKDRVWQVRYDKRSTETILGVGMGMSRDQVQLAAPRAYQMMGDSLYFDIVGLPFPVRARLVFTAGQLSDIYIYRSDF
jgi:hypothetical protein